MTFPPRSERQGPASSRPVVGLFVSCQWSVVSCHGGRAQKAIAGCRVPIAAVTKPALDLNAIRAHSEKMVNSAAYLSNAGPEGMNRSRSPKTWNASPPPYSSDNPHRDAARKPMTHPAVLKFVTLA